MMEPSQTVLLNFQYKLETRKKKSKQFAFNENEMTRFTKKEYDFPFFF